MGQLDSSPMGFYWLPIDKYDLSLTVFELINRLQKHFRLPAHLTRIGYDDKYRSRSYRFVQRQKLYQSKCLPYLPIQILSTL